MHIPSLCDRSQLLNSLRCRQYSKAKASARCFFNANSTLSPSCRGRHAALLSSGLRRAPLACRCGCRARLRPGPLGWLCLASLGIRRARCSASGSVASTARRNSGGVASAGSTAAGGVASARCGIARGLAGTGRSASGGVPSLGRSASRSAASAGRSAVNRVARVGCRSASSLASRSTARWCRVLGPRTLHPRPSCIGRSSTPLACSALKSTSSALGSTASRRRAVPDRGTRSPRLGRSPCLSVSAGPCRLGHSLGRATATIRRAPAWRLDTAAGPCSHAARRLGCGRSRSRATCTRRARRLVPRAHRIATRARVPSAACGPRPGSVRVLHEL